VIDPAAVLGNVCTKRYFGSISAAGAHADLCGSCVVCGREDIANVQCSAVDACTGQALLPTGGATTCSGVAVYWHMFSTTQQVVLHRTTESNMLHVAVCSIDLSQVCSTVTCCSWHVQWQRCILSRPNALLW
jgi:hypothetical protein